MRHTTERWVVGLTATAMMFGVSGCALLENLKEQLQAIVDERMQQGADEVVDISHEEVDEALVEAFETASVPFMPTGWIDTTDENGTVVVDRTNEVNGGLVTVAGTASRTPLPDGDHEGTAVRYEVMVTLENVVLEHNGASFLLDGSVEMAGEVNCGADGVTGHSTLAGTLTIASISLELNLSATIEPSGAHHAGTVNGKPYERLKTDLAWKVCAAL